MRRHKNLYGQIVSFQNLLRAAKLAQRNKRFRFATARFNFFLEKEICDLQKQLMGIRSTNPNFLIENAAIYSVREQAFDFLRDLALGKFRQQMPHVGIRFQSVGSC